MAFRILTLVAVSLAFGLIASCTNDGVGEEAGPVQVSGIYPHLAYYNQEAECGTGAVVPWAGRLWIMTYAPHQPNGSTDKLYEVTPGLKQIVRDESVGGTPANRMIHKESAQLFMGPYAIDTLGNVRVISYEAMPGRHTGNARHLTDPTNMIYYGTMEEGFYEVDVHTLEVTELYEDANRGGRPVHDPTDVNPQSATLAGAHGKGLYSGQGVLVYSNNGEATPEALEKFDIESGALAEWDGNTWKIIRRDQFVEVTGPGGIYGNQSPNTDPIWSTGFDHKSLLLAVRDKGTWSFFRLPKASHSYDGAHGWNTEWPRIRDVGTTSDPNYLMTMHGMFWSFPGGFTSTNTRGIRPRSAYLKVIGDFTRWKDQLIFGCDDSAQREFLNKRSLKGGIEGPGQSNSNLWFTSVNKPDQLGPTNASGYVWLNDEVKKAEYSEPFLFAGWTRRMAWISHQSDEEAMIEFEIDRTGGGNWALLESIKVPPKTGTYFEFDPSLKGEWIRAKVNRDLKVSLCFNYADKDQRASKPHTMFDGLSHVADKKSQGGLLYGLGDDQRSLGIAAQKISEGKWTSVGYYELDHNLQLELKGDEEKESFIHEQFAIPEQVMTIEASSVLVVDDQGRRWRFPLGNEEFTDLTNRGLMRICREVATERDLFNCHGTFYELPAENADGFAKVRPIASHQFRIHDYASYRGMLVMTGIATEGQPQKHIIRSKNGQAAVWVGSIDDLWQLGKPTGKGGPWSNTRVLQGEISDPYLIGFYDRKSLMIHHDSEKMVGINIQIQPVGHGPWITYQKIDINPGEKYQHVFPDYFQARWIRFQALNACSVTTELTYQ